MADPSMSFSLKAVLLAWAERDPVDAARDAEVLAVAFERRADDLLAEGIADQHAGVGS
ncbi:MAG: hypothetical protein K2X25_04160 [Caulobacteraceae bacterium]|nr:hypothetical protein [Caulobacteraceae bacterium]